MDRNSPYYRQVALLVRLLPIVAKERCFAMKGGTAINLFVRDFPRLSVDIDLVYLGDGGRNEALPAIASALGRIADDVEAVIVGASVRRAYEEKYDALRLVVSDSAATVKVELSPVLRGTVFPVETTAVTEAVEDEFGFAEIAVVSHADLYAGKLCAALDRQHPRDFFDVLLLLENEGLSDALRKAFIVYLISHGRPIEELLDPRWKDIEGLFEAEFRGMTSRELSTKELLNAGHRALAEILDGFTDDERRFLCGLYDQEQQWHLLGLEGVETLPAVQWKLANIRKMPAEKRKAALVKLEGILG